MRPMPSLALLPPYEESKHPYRYIKLIESCKQFKIINQNHILGQKQIDKTTLQNNRSLIKKYNKR